MTTAWRKMEQPELSECPSCKTQQYVPDQHCPDQCAINMTPDDVLMDMAIERLIDQEQERRHGI